jgi:hypothetical protein
MACPGFAELRSVVEQDTSAYKERHESHRPRNSGRIVFGAADVLMNVYGNHPERTAGMLL